MSEANHHTPEPWYSLSGKEGTVELSNSVGPHWSSPDHYVGSVLAHNAPLVKAAPDMLLELERCAIEIDMWRENRNISQEMATQMLARWRAINDIIDKARGI